MFKTSLRTHAEAPVSNLTPLRTPLATNKDPGYRPTMETFKALAPPPPFPMRTGLPGNEEKRSIGACRCHLELPLGYGCCMPAPNHAFGTAEFHNPDKAFPLTPREEQTPDFCYRPSIRLYQEARATAIVFLEFSLSPVPGGRKAIGGQIVRSRS